MVECPTHIVECLRNNNIQPVAYSSKELSKNNSANSALQYTLVHYFGTGTVTSYQWWLVDFKSFVEISEYQIKANNDCHWIKSWTAYYSSNNKTWETVDFVSRTEGPGDEKFHLKNITARFFRIIGSATGCEHPFSFAFFYVKFFGKTNAAAPKGMKNICTVIQRRIGIKFIASVIIMCS